LIYQYSFSNIIFLILLELNRFTINSVNHPHSNEGRRSLRDDGVDTPTYWFRSAGFSVINNITTIFSDGVPTSINATSTIRGFRPIL